jgi:hypothetical protein
MITALKNVFGEHGYNLVSLPKSGIKPLLLLYQMGNDVSSAESQLTTLFPPDEIASPPFKKDGDVMPVIGNAEASFDANTGGNFLQALLSRLNMGKAEAKLQLKAHDVLTFSFVDVKEDKVDLLALDRFITATTPDIEKFRSFGEKLKNSELYVINAVLKSTSFSIRVSGENGQDLDMQAQIKGILDGNVSISKAKNNAITLRHKDKQVPLVFAFKAQRIMYDKPSFWSGKPGGFYILDQPGLVLKGEEDIVSNPMDLGLLCPDI